MERCRSEGPARTQPAETRPDVRQGILRKVPVAVSDELAVGVADVPDDRAAPVGKVRAGGQPDLVLLAVIAVGLRPAARFRLRGSRSSA